VYDLNQMSIIVIVLIAFIATVGLENNSKEKIITEPEVLEVVKAETTEAEVLEVVKAETTEAEVLEVVKAETTEAEVLEVVKTTVDIEDSNKSFFNQYLYYIIGLILLICTFGYMYFRNQKNKSLTEFTNTANAEEKPLEDRVNSQLENESNLRTEQPSEPEVTPEFTEQSSEPEVTPEVTEQSSEPEVTPEVTEQSSEPEPIDEENITKDDDNK
jgi:hypothetical protein